MIKALVFDFFGVIGLSTYAYIKEVYKPNAKQLLALNDLHKSLDYGFINKSNFINLYADILNVSVDEITNIFDVADNHFSTSKLLLDFIDNNRCNYRIGLLSNVNGVAYKKYIQPIAKHFDAVVTSYSVQLVKPEEEIYRIMASKLGVDISECLMIDDSQLNCQGAIAAGMQAIKYTNYNSFLVYLNNYVSIFEK